MQNIPILGTKIAPCFALLDFRRGCCFLVVLSFLSQYVIPIHQLTK